MNKPVAIFVAALATVFCGVVLSTGASASGMSISPLEYRVNLKQNEFKKGFIDIVNPEVSSVDVGLSVQAFRQINDQGGLSFYEDKSVTRGIKLDLDSIELGPREGARIYFQLDAAQLPMGDVFAAIFAQPKSDKKNVQTIPSARVGTLLMITNGTPSVHHAEVQSLDANWLQIDDAITAHMLIKNTDSASSGALGFFPKIQISTWPYGAKVVDGPLIFAERSREVGYRQEGDYFGPVLLKASVDGKSVSRLVFVITGYWLWLAPIIVAILAAIVVVYRVFHISYKKHNNFSIKNR